MNPIRTKEQAIVHIEQHLVHSTARRAIAEGSIEWLGGFKHIPPGNGPGWILRARSRFGNTFYVALLLSARKKFTLVTGIVFSVPWKYWDGGESKDTLYCGDRPHLYRRLKG